MAAMNFPNGPSLGDKYPVTPIAGQPQYTWDGEKWTTVGSQISNATPSAAVPLMDATPGLPGSAAAYSRGDHVHPTDTTRAALTYVDANMVGYAAQTTTANQKAQARANVNVTKRNYIVNGGMMVSQENGATAGTLTVGTLFVYYPVDMFNTSISGTSGTITSQQVVSGGKNRARVTCTVADAAVAAGDIVYFEMGIEGLRTADLFFGTASAKTVTLQFGVRAPAGTYSVVLLSGNSGRSYVAEYVIAAGEANTDVIRSITIPGDVAGTWVTDNTKSMIIRWSLMVGTSFQGPVNVWGTGGWVGSSNQFNFMGTINNTFELFDVSLTEGSIAPPFQLPDYASELALCQRYYRKLGGTVAYEIFFQGYSPGAGVGASADTLPIDPPMRAAPTIAPWGVAPTLSNIASVAYRSGPTTWSFQAINSASGGTVYNSNVGGGLALNARL